MKNQPKVLRISQSWQIKTQNPALDNGLWRELNFDITNKTTGCISVSVVKLAGGGFAYNEATLSCFTFFSVACLLPQSINEITG